MSDNQRDELLAIMNGERDDLGVPTDGQWRPDPYANDPLLRRARDQRRTGQQMAVVLFFVVRCALVALARCRAGGVGGWVL